MAGWENSNEDIYVEQVEEFVDTNPDLYKQRTIVALNEGRYNDALIEAKLALSYGKQELQYHLLVARVLFEMNNYQLCMEKLISSGLWNQVSEEADNGDLLMDEVDFIFYAYAVCYKKLGKRNDNTDIVIVTPDGMGMYSDIQTAVNAAKSNQDIMITSGTYYGDITIRNRDVRIFGTSVGEINSNIYPILSGKILIENSDAKMYALSFNGANATENIIKISDSNVIINQCLFTNKPNITGIYVYKDSECIVEYSSFSNLNIGITNEVNRNVLTVFQCNFDRNRVGVVATDDTKVIDSKFFKNRDAGVYPVISRGEKIRVENSDFEENGCGIIIVDSKIDITNSKFYRNNYHIAFEDAGYFTVCDSSFIGSKGPSFVGKRNISAGRKLKEYVGYMVFDNCLLENNNSLARKDNKGMILLKQENNLTIRNNGELNSYAEGIKSFLNKWL